MQAIILAAGMGRRLGHLTEKNTKCMLEVCGIKLIDRTIDIIEKLGIKTLIIVVGYEARNLKDYLINKNYSIKIIFIENVDYAKTNNIYSLFLASKYLKQDDTILFESDLIFEENVVRKILNKNYPNIALVDKYESWMDGTVVTIDSDNNIKSFIPKKYFDYKNINNYYKTVNIYKFSKEFSQKKYLPFLEAYIKSYGDNEYYEQVLKVLTLLEDSGLKALPLEGEKWYEIDDIQDYDIASSMFEQNDYKQWEAYAYRYGGYWRYPRMLDFCYLVNPYFPPQNMVEEMKNSFQTLLTEYPSGMGVNSMLAAKYFDINPNFVVVGNGAAELIKAFIENNVGKMGVTFPTFEEYANRLSADKTIKYVPNNSNFAYSVDDLISFFSDKSIDTLLLINPDNPSGNYISYSDEIKLIEWAEKKGIKLIIDESFVDFADIEGDISLLNNEVLRKYTNLIVIKSISKSYGVPGLRLGVLASGDTMLIKKIKKDVSIWNINSFAEFYMQIFSKYSIDYSLACNTFIKERKQFYKDLSNIPFLRVIPSQANYFMCEVINGYKSKDLTVYLLKKHNILIKDCSFKEGFDGKQYVRIAIRCRNDNNILTSILTKVDITDII